jgi:hypothetical protein
MICLLLEQGPDVVLLTLIPCADSFKRLAERPHNQRSLAHL